jgi:hypothetical protein
MNRSTHAREVIAAWHCRRNTQAREMSLRSQIEKGAHFSRSHTDAGIIVLPNAWDAGSAIMKAKAGFRAIASTSAGIAFSMGLPDGQLVSRQAMFDRVAEIAADKPLLDIELACDRIRAGTEVAR